MDDSPYEDIAVSRPRTGVTLIAINRPEARNALRTAALGEIAAELDKAAIDESIGAVVITGSDKYFAAGADLKEMAALGPIEMLSDVRPKHWKRITTFPKPLIAAVNGYALGAGCELAMHADIIIAGMSAVFGQPEIKLGIIPGAGGTQRLVRAIGKSQTMKMVLTGEPIDARVALAAGLVAELVATEDTVKRAVEIAGVIASMAPLAVRTAKESVLVAFELGLTAALESERKSFVLLAASSDRQEGIAAFLEKRAPEYRGR
jgi:enoyl-CoA hydratase